MVRRLSRSTINAARAATGLPPLAPIARDCVYDPGSRLFVMSRAHGYDTLGVDRATSTADAVRAWAGLPGKPMTTPAEVWESYVEAMRLGAKHAVRTGSRCPEHLTPSLIGLEGRRVAVHVPGERVRRFTVGRSTGWFPIHLEIARRGCLGGIAASVPADARVEVVR